MEFHLVNFLNIHFLHRDFYTNYNSDNTLEIWYDIFH